MLFFLLKWDPIENRIARGKPAVWLVIEEGVFSADYKIARLSKSFSSGNLSLTNSFDAKFNFPADAASQFASMHLRIKFNDHVQLGSRENQ